MKKLMSGQVRFPSLREGVADFIKQGCQYSGFTVAGAMVPVTADDTLHTWAMRVITRQSEAVEAGEIPSDHSHQISTGSVFFWFSDGLIRAITEGDGDWSYRICQDVDGDVISFPM